MHWLTQATEEQDNMKSASIPRALQPQGEDKQVSKYLEWNCSQGDLDRSGCSAAGRSHNGLLSCLKEDSLKAGPGWGGTKSTWATEISASTII